MVEVIVKNALGIIQKQIWANEGEILSNVLKKNGILLDTSCNGKGICKRCQVILSKGNDRSTPFSTLACQYRLDAAIILTLPKPVHEQDQMKDAFLLQEDKKVQKKSELVREDTVNQFRKIEIAIDIGTTTLAFAFLDSKTKEILEMHSDINPQRKYGLDVISRMKASVEGNRVILKKMIWDSIMKNMEVFRNISNIPINIDKIVISANTPMQHMLLGDSCESLSKAPFCPISVEYREFFLKAICPKEVWENELIFSKNICIEETRLILLPGVSAFIGADIVSGICAMDLKEHELLLDLGTNGEMVLRSNQKLIATATAAGPALEAANISCGVAGIPGAIYKVNALQKQLQFETIDHAPVRGICGSGVIELIYELQKLGMMDRTGKLNTGDTNLYVKIGMDDNGKELHFLQEDIRQFQMAKAAIRAGMEILMQEAKILPKEIEKVYLAGGLGYSLNVFKAAGIGLISPTFRSKTKAVGNTSLLGAIAFLTKSNVSERMIEIASSVETINLAKTSRFEECYIQYMNF